MGEIKPYTRYVPMSRASAYNKKISRSEDMTSLVNNTLAVYASCRRNQQVITSMYPSNTDLNEMVLELKPGQTRTIVTLLANGLINGGAPLTAYVYCSTATEDHHISLEISCGSSRGTTANIEDTAENWHSVTCYPEISPHAGAKDARFIFLQVRNDDDADSETITIDSISIFEEPDPNTYPWIDWTGATNRIGVEDEPLSSAMMWALKRNLDYVARQRRPKANVYNRCLQDNERSTESAYEAANDGLGRYIIRTKADIDELVVLLNVDVEGTDSAAPNQPKAKFRVGAYDIDGNSIDSFEVEVTGPLHHFGVWVRDTLDISGRTAGDDVIEIRVDSKETNGTVDEQFLWNICVLESAVAADIDYELPNRAYVQPNDDIRAVDVLNVKNTVTHLYNTATQILLNDLRVNEPAQMMKVGSVFVNPVTYKGAVHNEVKYWSNKHAARGVLYPSHGSKSLVFEIFLDRPEPLDVCLAVKYDGESVDWENETSSAVTPTTITASSPDASYVHAIGRLIDMDVTNNIAYLDRCSGAWIDGDEMKRSDNDDTASINGAAYIPDGADVNLNVWIDTSHGTPFSTDWRGTLAYCIHVYDWQSFAVGNKAGPIRITTKIPIPEEAWNDSSLSDAHYGAGGTPERASSSYTMHGPTVFQVEAYNTGFEWNRPYVRLVRVYEETPSVL